jgi:hypothetical protein
MFPTSGRTRQSHRQSHPGHRRTHRPILTTLRGRRFAPLARLQSIGGTLAIRSNGISDIRLPALRSVPTIDLGNEFVAVLDLSGLTTSTTLAMNGVGFEQAPLIPQLTSLDGLILRDVTLASADFSGLATVVSMEVTRTTLRSITMPRAVVSLTVIGNDTLSAVDGPGQLMASLAVVDNLSLSRLSLPRAADLLQVENNPQLTDLGVDSLLTTTRFNDVRNPGFVQVPLVLESTEMLSLTVDGDVTLNLASVTWSPIANHVEWRGNAAVFGRFGAVFGGVQQLDDILINGANNLGVVSFPDLVTVGTINVQQSSLRSLVIPLLDTATTAVFNNLSGLCSLNGTSVIGDAAFSTALSADVPNLASLEVLNICTSPP